LWSNSFQQQYYQQLLGIADTYKTIDSILINSSCAAKKTGLKSPEPALITELVRSDIGYK